MVTARRLKALFNISKTLQHTPLYFLVSLDFRWLVMEGAKVILIRATQLQKEQKLSESLVWFQYRSRVFYLLAMKKECGYYWTSFEKNLLQTGRKL
jgi:hypothetical protein